MTYITKTCLRTLDQEPGGAACIQYLYRIKESSIGDYLIAHAGEGIIEYISSRELNTSDLADIFHLEEQDVRVDVGRTTSGASSDNPVPG